MEKIQRQRRFLLIILIGAAIFLHGVVIDYTSSIQPDSIAWMKYLKFVLTGGTLYSLIVLVPIWFYDIYLWKFLNPEYNFEGTWLVELYKMFPIDERHIKNTGLEAVKPYQILLTENTGEALIRQTPFRLFVQEASGFSKVTKDADLATWKAEILCVELPGKINVIFETISNKSILHGRDSLMVVSRDKRGRPLVLEGTAFHVIPHLDIVIKGAIKYKRK